MLRTWLVPSCLLSASLLAAQPPSAWPQSLRHMHHTTWTSGNGLDFTPTGFLVQSADGYLWFGSRSVLVRFDGARFARIDSSTSPLLQVDSGDVARPMLVDRNGVMWLKRSDGAMLHYKDGVFSMAIPPDGKRAPIFTAIEDGEGRMWVEIKEAIYLVEGKRLTSPRLPAGVPHIGITSIVRDTGSGIWIGSQRDGLWHVTGNRAERIPEPEGRTRGVSPVFQSSDGRLWAWGPQYLMVHEKGTWSPVLFNGTQIAPSAMFEHPRGQLWIGTQTAGLMRIVGDRIEQYSRRQGLGDVVVRDVLIDREDNLWILTDAGVERLRSSPFTTLGLADGVPIEQPSKLVPDESRGLWVRSTDEQLHHAAGGIISADTGTIRWSPVPLPGTGNRYPVSAGRDGSLFFWSYAYGVGRLHGGRSSVLATALQLDAAVVRAIHEDARGSVWIGAVTRGKKPGLARVSGGMLTHVTLERSGKPGDVSTIAEDSRGDLWVNNTARPIIYKLAGDSVVARIDSTAGIPAVVTTIAVQGLDTLWMLTNRASLLRVVGGRVARVRFAKEKPLLAPPWSTLLLANGSLWIATNDGIARLALAELHAAADGRGPQPVPRFYTDADGLPNARTPFTATGVATVAKDGRLWFSTSGGLAVYDTRFDHPNPVPPSVHIEEVVVDGKQVIGPIPPHPDRVEIHFTAISMRAPQRVRLEYMLEGADRSWVPATPQRVATYTQLRAREYRFHVRAWNEDGVPALTQGLLTLRVVPTWYETTWFRVLAIIALVAIGPLVVYRAVQRRARRRELALNARFDAALDERTRIARELHDTLLQGFSGITLQLHTVTHTMAQAPEKAVERLGRILTLADNTLIDARQMIWDLRAPELEHQGLSAALARAARDVIVDAPIELQFSVSGDERRLPPLVESTVLRVGREAATNAVRHARPRLIRIDLAYSETSLELYVHDDGSGFHENGNGAARSRGHWGIAGMRERALRAGGAVDIQSATDTGTTVSLRLPLK